MGKKSSENIFEGQSASVSYSLGVTINTGNFENVKSDIGMTMPCVPDQKSVDKTFKILQAEVTLKMKAEIRRLRKAAGI